jgi:hypothetical protein
VIATYLSDEVLITWWAPGPIKTWKMFLVLAHDRRRILHFNVVRHSTAKWTTLREAFPF